jgi:hypothetical protein
MNKWLYEFEAKNLIKKDDGSQETVTKKFALLKPNRRLREDGELFYAAETSRFAKAGVLPKAAWGTILSNGGGSISDQEREEYGQLLLKFRDASFELQSILIKGEGERTEAEKIRSKELIEQLEEIRKDIQNFEASQISIFENTAEAKARNRAILWWVMNLAYEKNGEEYTPLFKGASFEEKLLEYDSFEEEENKYEFLLGVVRRFMYLITLWFLGRADSVDDFKIYDANFIKENKIEPRESEKKEEKAKVSEIKVEEKISIIEEIKSE